MASFRRQSPRRRGRSLAIRLTVLLAFLPLTLVSLGILAPAESKTVGIVFDDSGSMQNRAHLPTFGAQLLVGTLDGRPGQDRLFSTRLSQFIRAFQTQPGSTTVRLPAGVRPNTIGPDNIGELFKSSTTRLFTEHQLTTAPLQQQTIDRIAREWADIQSNMPTPYLSVEIMLDVLTREADADDDVFLVVITDGEFNNDNNEGIPPPGRLRRNYETYRNRLTGASKAFFLLIDQQRGTVESIVRQQQVRATLLDVFNGDPNVGAYTVADQTSLFRALRTIVSEISSTDIATSGPYISAAGNSMELNSPVSVSRVVALSTANQSATLPTLDQTSINNAERVDFDMAMQAEDGAWPGIKQQGHATHLRLHPAISPGTYSLDFNAPVRDRVEILLETNLTLALQIIDPKQGVIRPNAQNIYELVLDRPYEVHAILGDVINGQMSPVTKPDLINSATLVAFLEGQGGRRSLPLTKDPAVGGGTAPMTLTEAGRYEIFSSMRLPGFVTGVGAPLQIEALDADADFTVALTSEEPCSLASCQSGDLQTTVTDLDSGEPVRIAAIDVTMDSRFPGSFSVQLENAPAGMVLTDGAGHRLAADTKVQAQPGRTQRLFLARTADLALAATGGTIAPMSVGLVISGTPPLRGSSRQTLTVRPHVPAATLNARGHSQDLTGDTPMDLTAADLQRANQAFDFQLTGALSEPKPDDFLVEDAPPCLDFAFDVVGFQVSMTPSMGAFWCPCLIKFLYGGRWTPTVTYNGSEGLQKADSRVTLVLNPTWSETLFGCLTLLLILLAILWLLVALRNYMITNRFPRGSFLKLEESGDLPRFVPLRGSNWTLLRALLMPFRVPHERKAEAGLTFQATPQGANLVFQSGWPEFTLERLGQTLEEIKPDARRGQADAIRLYWDDELTEPGRSGMRMTLKKRLTDTD